MNRFYQAALGALGVRQKAYKATFTEGSHAHLTLLDLATYSRAFAADPDGMSKDQIMVMHGRRQMFFRIFKNLKLTPVELEIVSKGALLRAAERLATQGAEE